MGVTFTQIVPLNLLSYRRQKRFKAVKLFLSQHSKVFFLDVISWAETRNKLRHCRYCSLPLFNHKANYVQWDKSTCVCSGWLIPLCWKINKGSETQRLDCHNKLHLRGEKGIWEMGQLQARVLLELWTEGCAERIESAHISSNKEPCVWKNTQGKKNSEPYCIFIWGQNRYVW